MSKGKALGLAVLCCVIAIFLLIFQVGGCAVPFLIMAAIFGFVWFSKSQRDNDFIKEAETVYQEPLIQSPLPPMVQSSMMNNRNSRLFVPPSLEDRY